MASELVVGVFSLGGVVLGFVGAVLRDLRTEHKAERQARRATMSAARHVWYEVAEFMSATDAAAAVPSLKKDDRVIGPLRSREQWSRYGDVLASEETVDFAAIQEAYAAARFADGSLRAGAPPDKVNDQYREQFEAAMATLGPLAKLVHHNTNATPKQ